MEKKKVIMKIESFSHKDGTLLLSTSYWSIRASLKDLVELCDNKYGGFVRLELSPPYRARTTGLNSQNNLIWKLITIIAKATGNELSDVEDAVKERAIKRGYPYRQNKLTGKPVPASMTTITTVEAGYLIDELYAIANEYEINVEGAN